jgi:hypothetical protein
MSVEHKEILAELAMIRAQLEEIKRSCAKMGEHVDFVDDVYVRVRAPFMWLMKKISCVSGIGGSAIALDEFKKLKES